LQFLETLHGQSLAQSTPISNVTDQASFSVSTTISKIVNKADDMTQRDHKFNVASNLWNKGMQEGNSQE